MRGKAGTYAVVAGLSASGKTTLARSLSRIDGTLVKIREHVDMLGGSHRFPPAPHSISEKKAKQDFFFDLDVRRCAEAGAAVALGRTAVADTDFTSALAYNWAERQIRPDLDVFGWLCRKYLAAIGSGAIRVADIYVYLDAAPSQRAAMRQADAGRRRNDIFFREDFASRQRRFHWVLMHPDSPARALPAVWLPVVPDPEEMVERVRELLERPAPAPRAGLGAVLAGMAEAPAGSGEDRDPLADE